jgi:hypothetical protein
MRNAKFGALLIFLAALCTGTLRAQNVVTDWTAIASTTIVKNGGEPSATSSVWFAYAIGCWNAKFTYNFWRPVTAIQAGRGNPDLVSDPDWTPLGITPSHPEYPAAHGCVTGTISQLIEGYFGTPQVHVVVDSLVFSDGIHTHIFENTHDLFHEVFWARIYAGFHFHHSLVDGGRLGKKVAEQLQRKYFRPVDD